MSAPKKRLGDILIECGMLTAEQLQSALEYGKTNGIRVGESVKRMGLVSEADIQWAIADQLGISQIRLTGSMVMDEVKRLAPADFLKTKGIIPMMMMSNQSVSVAMPDPLDDYAKEDFKKLTGLEVAVSICTQADFNSVLQEVFGLATTQTQPIDEVADGKQTDGKAYAEKLFNYILKESVVHKLSHIHFYPVATDVGKLAFRNQGIFQDKLDLDIQNYTQILKMFRGRCKIDPDNPGKGVFKFKAGNDIVKFTAQFFNTIKGEALSLICEFNIPTHSLTALKIDDGSMNGLGQVLSSEKGLILIGGDFFSGRTRLLYGILNDLASHGRRVVTFELDPLEEMKGWVQVPCTTPKSLEDKSHSFLPLDGDVYYFSHLPSGEFFRRIVYLASTRKLFFAKSDMRNSRYFLLYLRQLMAAEILQLEPLNAFIGVNNLGLLCDGCKKPVEGGEYQALQPQLREFASDFPTLATPNAIPLFARGGCEKCHQSGFARKQYLLEIFPITPVLRRRMVANPADPLNDCLPVQSIQKQGYHFLEKGMISIHDFLSL